MTTTPETLRDLAQRGVGFEMNPTMMFTTAESMYSQWLDYFTRLDQEWRERVAAAADALSTPTAGDARGALVDHLNGLMDSLDESVSHDQIYDQLLLAWNMARDLHPSGTVADAEAERAAILADLREWSRPLGESPEEDALRLVIARIEARS